MGFLRVDGGGPVGETVQGEAGCRAETICAGMVRVLLEIDTPHMYWAGRCTVRRRGTAKGRPVGQARGEVGPRHSESRQKTTVQSTKRA